MKTFTIPEHWDQGAILTAQSNPAEEFRLWQEHAENNPDDWTGDEFTLEDFEEWIANLASKPPTP